MIFHAHPFIAFLTSIFCGVTALVVKGADMLVVWQIPKIIMDGGQLFCWICGGAAGLAAVHGWWVKNKSLFKRKKK